MRKYRAVRAVSLVIVIFISGACGDSSSPTSASAPMTTTTTAPSPPTTALVALDVEFIEGELSPEREKFLRLRWRVTLTESGGVRAKINFIRQDMWSRDFDKFERAELGFEALGEACGTYFVEADAQWQCDVRFDINSTNFEGFIRITVALVDDHDNNIVLVHDLPLFDL